MDLRQKALAPCPGAYDPDPLGAGAGFKTKDGSQSRPFISLG
jgi:hypothetical protein